MKATGIVRRIDDLGRVVIPKEIRRVLRIREGDPLEIFTEKDGEVIFKKYSPMGELAEFSAQICDSLHNMRTLESQPANKQYKIAGETQYIYAPLANRLGLNKVKSELENLSFQYEHPKEYQDIVYNVILN